jgi:ADP-ribosylation factor-like protein 6
MGSVFSSKKEIKLIVVGLDNSGKSTMINTMKNKKTFNEVTPTVGYNIEKFEKANVNFTMFDMSGQNKYRDMWSDYCKNVDGIIFVIDSVDKLRF